MDWYCFQPFLRSSRSPSGKRHAVPMIKANVNSAVVSTSMFGMPVTRTFRCVAALMSTNFGKMYIAAMPFSSGSAASITSAGKGISAIAYKKLLPLTARRSSSRPITRSVCGKTSTSANPFKRSTATSGIGWGMKTLGRMQSSSPPGETRLMAPCVGRRRAFVAGQANISAGSGQEGRCRGASNPPPRLRGAGWGCVRSLHQRYPCLAGKLILIRGSTATADRANQFAIFDERDPTRSSDQRRIESCDIRVARFHGREEHPSIPAEPRRSCSPSHLVCVTCACPGMHLHELRALPQGSRVQCSEGSCGPRKAIGTNRGAR